MWVEKHYPDTPALELSILRNDDKGIFVKVMWDKERIHITRQKGNPIIATFDQYEAAEGMDMVQFIDNLIATS